MLHGHAAICSTAHHTVLKSGMTAQPILARRFSHGVSETLFLPPLLPGKQQEICCVDHASDVRAALCDASHHPVLGLSLAGDVRPTSSIFSLPGVSETLTSPPPPLSTTPELTVSNWFVVDHCRLHGRAAGGRSGGDLRVRHADGSTPHLQPVLDDPQALHRAVRADPGARRVRAGAEAPLLRLLHRPRRPLHDGQAGQPQPKEDPAQHHQSAESALWSVELKEKMFG